MGGHPLFINLTRQEDALVKEDIELISIKKAPFLKSAEYLPGVCFFYFCFLSPVV